MAQWPTTRCLVTAVYLVQDLTLAGPVKELMQPNLFFPDQFDGKFFDATLPTTGLPQNSNVNYFDMQVGMNYAYFPQENVYINAGYSIHHVNKPRETFYQDKNRSPV
jgi:hypothetical protein